MTLTVPTVMDRVIQQAVAQVVQRCCEPHFHPNSYGFRPGRNAHQAMRHAQAMLLACVETSFCQMGLPELAPAKAA